MAPRETANNAYAKFWDDKQKVLWCVVVFSGVVNCGASELNFVSQVYTIYDLRFHNSFT